MPSGGFGNLIALPLQHGPRLAGNSVFLDANFEPHAEGRMMKVKQKISGCFRSLDGALDFAVIRSFISTAKKQGWNIIRALTQDAQIHASALRTS
jgi:hypothetical protein